MITVDQINQSLNQKVNEADAAVNAGNYMAYQEALLKCLIAMVFILFLFVRKHIEYNEPKKKQHREMF